MWMWLTSCPARSGAAHRLMDRTDRSSPSRPPQASPLSSPRQTSWSGIESATAATLAARSRGHLGMGLGRIIDVAGARRFLDPADAMLEPRRARLDPRPGEVVVAGIGHDPLAFRRRACRRSRPGTARSRSCPAPSTARRHWRYSRRSAASPGSCSGSRCGTASIAHSNASAGERAAITGSGVSPLRP